MRYLKLWLKIFTTSLKEEIEFRTNFILELLIDACWFSSIIVMFEGVSRLTQLSNNWTPAHFRFFAGIVFLTDALFAILAFFNFENFADRVANGTLDSLLTKPVDSQFLASFEKSSPPQTISAILSVAWIFWAASQIPDFQYLKLLWLILLIPCGVWIHVSLRLIIASFNIRHTRLDSLGWVWYQFYRMSQRPDYLYGPTLQRLFRTLIPISFLSSIPSLVVLGNEHYWLGLCAPIVALVFHILARNFWLSSLKNYTSASS
jgi:ABC-2 type transport system permease protein